MERVKHTFEPVFNEGSRILILGTFPSVKSRETHFFYGHPQNRFWKVMAALTGWETPGSIEEKKKLLLKMGLPSGMSSKAVISKAPATAVYEM